MTSSLVIVVRANQGYWQGGQEQTVILSPAVNGSALPVDLALRWDLSFEKLKLAHCVATVGWLFSSSERFPNCDPHHQRGSF